ncbi:MAG: class I SAM-dependent methyltransferase [archaeon]
MEYIDKAQIIKKRLEVAHDADEACVRRGFFEAENAFFKKHINGQKVLVAGSGLGHDVFEIAEYNKKVVGVEILDLLVGVAKNNALQRRLDNVTFVHGDFMRADYSDKHFDSAVLNMGTIGNFDDKAKVLLALLRISKKVFFDFYPPCLDGLQMRKKMYEEEKWENVRVDGTKVVSDDGLDSVSLSVAEVEGIVKSIGAKVKFYDLNYFSVMAVVE